eukprot:352800-Chlamydomonas_euryale.AAC.13
MPAELQLVNARFEIIQAMLNIWRQHQHSTHYWRLNVIVAVLVALEVILAAFQVAGMILIATRMPHNSAGSTG